MNVVEFIHSDPGAVSRQALEDLIGLLARQAARDDHRIDQAGDGKCAARGVEANGR